MSTINRLSSVDVLQPGDQIPVWDSSNGDTRKASMTTLLAFVESYFADPDYSTRIVAPNTDYFTVDIGNTGDSILMIVHPTFNFANGTITLPPATSAVNDQEITVVFTAAVSTFVITSSGATVLGAPVSINGYDSFRVRYNAAQLTWYTLDTTGDGSGSGVSQIIRQDFTGNGTTTTFTLTTAPSALGNELQIFIDGVYQERSGYTVTGSNIIFSEAPPSLSTIEVLGWSVSIGAETTSDLVSYTLGATGSVLTTVQAKLRESVSVKDFGAVGDGVTDDTAAIQAAIVASENVNFPKGNYLISVSLLLTANTRITADGAILIASAGFSAGSYTFKSMITDGEDVAVENVSIDGLVFNGSSVASIVGVHTLNSANQSFTNLEMYNLNAPLLLRGDNLVPTNLLVQHCEIYDCVTGISVSGLHRDQILVKDNFVHRIDGSGIALQDSVGAEVSGNSCVRCGEVNGNGIFIKGCSDIEVINNFCSQNSILAFSGSGIGINMSGAFTNQGIVITGNVVERSGDDGIDCYTELLAVNKNIIISNNILRSNTNSGINATTATGGVQNDFIISNNQIYDNGFHGIGLTNCDGFVITDNMLTDNSQTTSGSYWAMYASNLESSTITGNVVKNTIAFSQNGLALDGASQNCVLKDNSVESSHTPYLINSYVNNLVNLGIWTSFSPTLSIGGTASAPGDVTTSIGYYEVVDHTLNFTILLEIASAAALTGILRIQTLPFANLSSGLGGTSAIFPCAVVGTTVGIDAYNYAYLEAGADFMVIERSDTGADLTNSIFGSGIVFRVSGQYRIS